MCMFQCCQCDLCFSTVDRVLCFSAVSCALSLTEMVVKNFATLIKATVTGQPLSTVNIAAEERSVI